MSDLEFSPDGHTIASLIQPVGCNNCGLDDDIYGIQLWDLAASGSPTALDAGNPVGIVKFTPDGKTLAADHFEGSYKPNTLRLWNVKTRQLQHSLTLPSGMFYTSSLAFSPDAKILAGANRDPTHNPLVLWDVPTGKPLRVLTESTGGVRAIDFSPDGNWLAYGTSNGTVKFWRIR